MQKHTNNIINARTKDKLLSRYLGTNYDIYDWQGGGEMKIIRSGHEEQGFKNNHLWEDYGDDLALGRMEVEHMM